MAKKRVLKRKLRLFRFMLLLLILLIIGFLVYTLLNSKVKNITITGTKYINDDEILEISNLKNYPSFILTFDYGLEKKIKKINLVKKVNIKRGFYNTITINIDEYKILLRNKDNTKYILENGKLVEIGEEISVPRLVSDLESSKYNQLLKALLDIKTKELSKVSEIEYVPNEYDKDRFILYMNDGNSVYLTLTKFEMLNYYDKVLPQLEGRKGFLYLDSGNHFKIME